MKLQHMLGGLEGLGPVSTEKRAFVEEWEKIPFGVQIAMIALSPEVNLPSTPSTFNTVWTWAHLRTAAEGMNPFDYFRFRYFEKWLGGLSAAFVSLGYISQEELDARTGQYLAEPDSPLPTGGSDAIDARILTYLIRGDSPKRDIDVKPMFAVGDMVVVKDPPSVAHSRVPGFLRKKRGVIDAVYPGSYVYLDDIPSDGIGKSDESATPVYCVRFEPEEIWPGNAEPGFAVYADLFAPYLAEHVSAAASGRSVQ